MKPTNDLLLRRALLGNALFSTVCGLVLLAGAVPLGPLLGVPSGVLALVGASLLPFAWTLNRHARAARVPRGQAWWAVGLDLAWVVGSAALVLGRLWPLEPAGTWSVIVVADVVLLWALLQTAGLVRSRGAESGELPGETA